MPVKVLVVTCSTAALHFGISVKVMWIDRVFSSNPHPNQIWFDLRIYEIIEITHRR